MLLGALILFLRELFLFLGRGRRLLAPFQRWWERPRPFLAARPDILSPGWQRETRGNTALRMATLTFKVTDEEARLIRSRARRERVTVSEYLRRRAILSLAPARKPAKVRCPHTGAMIFASPDNQPPLTTDAVRELLSDFP